MLKRRPLFLLHGTSSVYLPLIGKEGLKDPYLTNSEKMASYFAEEAHSFEKSFGKKASRPVVLQVAVDPWYLRVDEEMWANPLDWIKREHHIERDQEWFEAVREGYIDSPVTRYDWEISLKMVHAVKYEGTISPEQLGAPRRPRS